MGRSKKWRKKIKRSLKQIKGYLKEIKILLRLILIALILNIISKTREKVAPKMNEKSFLERSLYFQFIPFLLYFHCMNSICINGKMVPANQPTLMADTRGYRYGDGLFETMKLLNGRIILEDYHIERLFNGSELLKFQIPSSFTVKKLRQNILALCKANRCSKLARIRLSLFRGHGGLYDKSKAAQYIIECSPADPSANQLNEKGLSIGIFPDAEKSCDTFANLKSANYLPYVMASEYAKENKLDDCLIYNVKGHIADATIANIFLVKNNLIITPSLEEGCVSGVMRRHLVEKIRASAGKFDIREGVVTKNDLETFHEVFLTNAFYGIRHIKKFGNKTYSNIKTKEIYKEYIEPLYS